MASWPASATLAAPYQFSAVVLLRGRRAGRGCGWKKAMGVFTSRSSGLPLAKAQRKDDGEPGSSTVLPDERKTRSIHPEQELRNTGAVARKPHQTKGREVYGHLSQDSAKRGYWSPRNA